MEIMLRQCPMCLFESQCEVVFQHHMKTDHETFSLLEEFIVQNEHIICPCDICTATSDMKIEVKDELFEEFNFEDTILMESLLKCEAEADANLINQKCAKSANSKKYKEEMVNEIMVFKCEQCSFQTKQKNSMRVHIKGQHTAEEEIKWFQCDHCSFKTKTRSCFNYHLFKHKKPEDIKWFKCEQCEYKAKTQGRLNQHIVKTHTAPEDVKWLKCEHCPHIAKRKPYLKQHMLRKHPNQAKYLL
ncbi:hypothetical protein BDFB_012210 [Asbolus verrucosus]|uniref:C2H2-type domain-containing protein n=1 Tax=Asbolus verrucosus TaxID=1661398 RepID=A0A482W7F6_ASBVE|nr:hypothetical protein BDFB_012210 [Asbolus verrucosus]